MVPALFGRRSEDAGGRVPRGPRVNVVAVAVLLTSMGLGLLGSRAARSPMPLIAMTLVGAALMRQRSKYRTTRRP